MNENAQAAAPPTAVQHPTGARVGAAIIDFVLLIVVFVVFAMLFGSTEPEGENTSGFNLSLEGTPALLYFLVVFGYYWLLEAATGQTLGKKAMGIKVVTLDGSPYNAGKALVRNLLRIVDGLPFLYLLGFIIMSASKNKQRLGDMIAGTTVVKV